MAAFALGSPRWVLRALAGRALQRAVESRAWLPPEVLAVSVPRLLLGAVTPSSALALPLTLSVCCPSPHHPPASRWALTPVDQLRRGQLWGGAGVLAANRPCDLPLLCLSFTSCDCRGGQDGFQSPSNSSISGLGRWVGS